MLNARSIFDEDNGQKECAKIHKLLEILVFLVFSIVSQKSKLNEHKPKTKNEKKKQTTKQNP